MCSCQPSVGYWRLIEDPDVPDYLLILFFCNTHVEINCKCTNDNIFRWTIECNRPSFLEWLLVTNHVPDMWIEQCWNSLFRHADERTFSQSRALSLVIDRMGFKLDHTWSLHRRYQLIMWLTWEDLDETSETDY